MQHILDVLGLVNIRLNDCEMDDPKILRIKLANRSNNLTLRAIINENYMSSLPEKLCVNMVHINHGDKFLKYSFGQHLCLMSDKNVVITNSEREKLIRNYFGLSKALTDKMISGVHIDMSQNNILEMINEIANLCDDQ